MVCCTHHPSCLQVIVSFISTPTSEQEAAGAMSLVTGLRLGEQAATGTGAFVSPFSSGGSLGSCSWHITSDPLYYPSFKPCQQVAQAPQEHSAAQAVERVSSMQWSWAAERAVEQVAVIAAPGPGDTMAVPAQWEPIRDCQVAMLCDSVSGWWEETAAEGSSVEAAAGGAAAGSDNEGAGLGGGGAREVTVCSRAGQRKGG